MRSEIEKELDKLEKEDELLDRRRKKLEKELAKEKKHGLSLGAFKLILFLLLVIVIAIAIIIFLRKKINSADDSTLAEKIEDTVEDIVVGEPGKVEIVTETMLKRVVRDAALKTAVYPYNGVAKINGTSEDGFALKAYVSYHAEISAGFDSRKVQLFLDEESGTITIRLPEIEIYEPVIDGDFQYIFMDQKYNTGNIYNEAFSAVKGDINVRIGSGELQDIKEVALESAKLTERALIAPLVDQLDPDSHYSVEVLAYDE